MAEYNNQFLQKEKQNYVIANILPRISSKVHIWLIMISRPWPASQLVRALSCCAKDAGTVPGQSTHKNQPMNA